MARFDWYQATVDAEVPPLMEAVHGVTDGGKWEPMTRAPHGYGGGHRLVDTDGPVAQIWYGGCHPLPHVVASGESAQAVAEMLRGGLGGQPFDHRVTRADACIDFAEPGAYDRLQAIALDLARERRIAVGTAGDHLVTMEGRTLYLGAPSSHTRSRLYDKAAELRAKFRWDARRLTIPDELARLEIQVRPKTPEARTKAATLSPVEMMGSAAWTRELMSKVADLQIEPFEAGRPWRQADDDRAYSALLAQYGGMLKRLAGDLGSWDLVGRQIGDDLAERAQLLGRRR